MALRLKRAGRRTDPIQGEPTLALGRCDKVREPCKPRLVFVAGDEAKKVGLRSGAYLRYCGRDKEKPEESTYVRVSSPKDAAQKNRRVCECVTARKGRNAADCATGRFRKRAKARRKRRR